MPMLTHGGQGLMIDPHTNRVSGAAQRSSAGQLPESQISHLLTPEEVAARTGLSLETLAQWRSQKRCIPYLKVGRSVRYDPLDVQQYLAGCRVSVSLPNERRWR